MRVRATFTHPYPEAGQHTSGHLVISLDPTNPPLDAPTRPAGPAPATSHAGQGSGRDGQRSRVAVVPAVDCSGSMASDAKLTKVTQALTHLTNYLTPTDQVALVTFDHDAQLDVSVRASDSAGLHAFTQALAAAHPRGSTNLHHALRTAIAAANRTAATTTTRVIVLTDGRANVGPASAQDLLAVLDERANHVTCSFIGGGIDCDHELRGQLAAAGGGSYGFIETAAEAADVLGAEVGGLLDTYAHQVQVTVKPVGKYLQIAADGPLALPWRPVTDQPSAADGFVVNIGGLLHGVVRHVVVPVTLVGPRRPHARPVTCAHVHVTGVLARPESPSGGGQEVLDGIDVTLRPKAHFTSGPGGAAPTDADSTGADPAEARVSGDRSVAIQLREIVDLAVVADAVQRARRFATTGDLTAASALLGQVNVTTAAADTLLRSISDGYNDPSAYRRTAPLLSSTYAAATGSLSGSSTTFNAMTSRVMGGYRSPGQLRTAAATTAATTGSSGGAHTPDSDAEGTAGEVGTPRAPGAARGQEVKG